MTGCQTCGGFGNRHDPVAHGTEQRYEDLTCFRARHEDGGEYCAAHGQSWPCIEREDDR